MTRAIIIANGLIFIAQMILGNGLSGLLALWPLGDGFMPWQIVTYGFIHGGLSHIFFNMYGLSIFGSEIERVWGGRCQCRRSCVPKDTLKGYQSS